MTKKFEKISGQKGIDQGISFKIGFESLLKLEKSTLFEDFWDTKVMEVPIIHFFLFFECRDIGT